MPMIKVIRLNQVVLQGVVTGPYKEVVLEAVSRFLVEEINYLETAKVAHRSEMIIEIEREG